MNKIKNGIEKSILLLFIFLMSVSAHTQNVTIGNAKEIDEGMLYAQTKQLGQFIRRFNNEEDRFGNRLFEGDSLFRNVNIRKKYIEYLFDEKNKKNTDAIKSEFNSHVTNMMAPTFLSLKDTAWFAEVNASFRYKGKKVDLIMYMKTEVENLGLKWVIANVYFEEFNNLFFTQPLEKEQIKFIHPMSHELDFMNLRKIFDNNKNIEYYAGQKYSPDHLTLFIYEIKQGNLTFESVNEVKFHFFQVNNWYFEVSEFNRNSFNSGWLISNIFKVPEAEKKRFFNQMLNNYY